MKKRILSGIQPSGQLHIGNYFGMIKRMVDYQENSDLFCMIVNLHSLTSLSDGEKLRKLTHEAVLDLLALGIDPERSHFWVQSHVPEVTELAWILSTYAPMGMMERAHSYKDKIAKGLKPNLGLFSYPMLMAADILINQSELIPVGKDQKQHVEMTRDIAIKFNNAHGDIFTIPEVEIPEEVAVIPGIDGQKMSKSYNNTIPIFGSEKEIKKAVMSIKTDSKGVDEPKDPETCNVFAIYKLFANESEKQEMAAQYRAGGIGYGLVKMGLAAMINNKFAKYRDKRKGLAENPKKVEEILEKGAEKVRRVSLETMDKVRVAVGL